MTMADEESSADKESSPPKKKRNVSLSLSKRFKRATEEELKTLSFHKMPKNTEASTKWSIKNFTDWFHGYNSRNPDNKCPDELLLPTCSVEVLNKWLCLHKHNATVLVWLIYALLNNATVLVWVIYALLNL